MRYRTAYYVLIALRFVLLAVFLYLFVTTGRPAYLVLVLLFTFGVVLSAVLKARRVRLSKGK